MRTKPVTIRVCRTGISMPCDLLASVDAAARARGESRSRFIASVLRAAVRARRDADITRRLDELFSDPKARDEQRRGASDLDRGGTDWSDESW